MADLELGTLRANALSAIEAEVEVEVLTAVVKVWERRTGKVTTNLTEYADKLKAECGS